MYPQEPYAETATHALSPKRALLLRSIRISPSHQVYESEAKEYADNALQSKHDLHFGDRRSHRLRRWPVAARIDRRRLGERGRVRRGRHRAEGGDGGRGEERRPSRLRHRHLSGRPRDARVVARIGAGVEAEMAGVL